MTQCSQALVCVSLLLGAGWSACAESRAFTVLTYNVENLFDLDGVALYSDYEPVGPGNPFGYNRERFLSKLDGIVGVILAADDPQTRFHGPDIILLQELESDFTPKGQVEDFERFLEKHSKRTVPEMLFSEVSGLWESLSSTAWLLKRMAESGLEDYHVAVTPAKKLSAGIAHSNAVFSRFPIQSVKYHPIPQARDIMEVELNINGTLFVIYVNHWKSGASDPKRESIRVENAQVLRRLVDERLAKNPDADLLIAGDLNSHYNHAKLYAGIKTGINHVLGAQGDESFEAGDLYNLWYELSPEQRYSEIWRGRRGTLMQMILAKGLYDQEGISYVDGSFEVHKVPGLNEDALGRPLRWTFAGKGGGTSDHFPLIARFEKAPFKQHNALSEVEDAPNEELPHQVTESQLASVPPGDFLGSPFNQDPGKMVGRQYRVAALVKSTRPLTLKVGEREWPAYAPDPSDYHALGKLKEDATVELVVTPGLWKGELQLVVESIF